MNMIPGNNYQIEAQIKSPMGWIKILGEISLQSETAFSGHASLMGFTVELTDCVKDGSHLCFAASPKLPFGVLHVEINADIAEDGTITGVANAPRHRPMEIKGKMVSSCEE